MLFCLVLCVNGFFGDVAVGGLESQVAKCIESAPTTPPMVQACTVRRTLVSITWKVRPSMSGYTCFNWCDKQ